MDTMDDDAYWAEWGPDHLCPNCQKPTRYEPDCPGYPGTTYLKDGTPYNTTMVCYPYCGNANRYECPDCGWWWREENRRSTTEYNYELQRKVDMGPAPAWLEEAEGRLNPRQDDEDEDETPDLP